MWEIISTKYHLDSTFKSKPHFKNSSILLEKVFTGKDNRDNNNKNKIYHNIKAQTFFALPRF